MSWSRLHRINALGAQHALERSRRFVGRTQDVLVEGSHSKDPTIIFGRNPHNRLVYFPGRLVDLQGKIVPVLITDAKPYSLVGKIAGS